MNIKKFFEKVERYMAAAAFAEAGEHATAVYIAEEDRLREREVKRPTAVQRETKRLD